MAKKKAFGGKVIDLKASGMADMKVSKLFEKEFPKLTIPPTAVMGAFWKALRSLEKKAGAIYFGTPEELKGKKSSKEKESEITGEDLLEMSEKKLEKLCSKYDIDPEEYEEWDEVREALADEMDIKLPKKSKKSKK